MTALNEALITVYALVRAVSSVDPQVPLQVIHSAKALPTVLTLVRLDRRVSDKMLLQVAATSEGFVAVLAAIRTIPGVSPHMTLQVTRASEHFPTERALILAIGVSLEVQVECLFLTELFVALVTGIYLVCLLLPHISLTEAIATILACQLLIL